MTIYSEFSHEKWWFSIAMLNYQRVSPVRQPHKTLFLYGHSPSKWMAWMACGWAGKQKEPERIRNTIPHLGTVQSYRWNFNTKNDQVCGWQNSESDWGNLSSIQYDVLHEKPLGKF